MDKMFLYLFVVEDDVVQIIYEVVYVVVGQMFEEQVRFGIWKLKVVVGDYIGV